MLKTFQVICQKSDNGNFWATDKEAATLGNCTEDDGQGIGKPGNEKPENGKPGSGRPENPGSGRPGSQKPNWDKPDIMPEIEKTLASECPNIDADPNEAETGPICNDYLCGRNCTEGFKPTLPMKVR